MAKLRVGVLGATGMVGQKFITLLENHPWFEVVAVAASPRSAGKKYSEAVEGRWYSKNPIPDGVSDLVVSDVKEIDKMKGNVDFVFSALDMPKDEIKALEDKYAENDIPVVSNNSAHRWTKDVPMIMPEINPHHIALIDIQRKNHGWKKGFVVVKPNCSLQSYLPAIAPLMDFKPNRMIVCTMQAVSGAGKTFETFPEIADNVIPFIKGEEEKSEQEPLKILGKIKNGEVVNFDGIKISAHCNRVPTSDGHMAAVSVGFRKKPTREQILELWKDYKPLPQQLKLPSAPDPVLIYHEDETRPQTRLDRDNGNGMAITIGRLRECFVLDYRFVALSHNTVRGAAGGAILTAELLKAKGYL
ncbi:MAG: aspartate-semialdehyde dehydrogenase [Candidatus Micrarchaeia archaeon]